mmetsp:Transcript_18246/g.52180  ORF Transcript_18246/g.52180 Transcript_18246/m.52180 type:complete len:234 (-) Transcript_18246:959-1660(-)
MVQARPHRTMAAVAAMQTRRRRLRRISASAPRRRPEPVRDFWACSAASDRPRPRLATATATTTTAERRASICRICRTCPTRTCPTGTAGRRRPRASMRGPPLWLGGDRGRANCCADAARPTIITTGSTPSWTELGRCAAGKGWARPDSSTGPCDVPRIMAMPTGTIAAPVPARHVQRASPGCTVGTARTENPLPSIRRTDPDTSPTASCTRRLPVCARNMRRSAWRGRAIWSG